MPKRSSLAFAALFVRLLSASVHSQEPVVGQPLPLQLARRVEVLLRNRGDLPPASIVHIGPLATSELTGYDSVSVTFTDDGKESKPIEFLISKDFKTVAQLTKYDITSDPRTLIPPAGRPSRGGSEDAPVLIVGFDDLECPFCAKLHLSLFPIITERYGDKVHIVYKDFPLEQHPWAVRGAVDVNCLGAQSVTGYWKEVDYIHAHAADIGGDPSNDQAKFSLERATDQLDKITRRMAEAEKAQIDVLDACIARQDTRAVDASHKLGMMLNVDSTPTLFINGAKVDGAVPVEFIFSVIDDALRAAGVAPPPSYVPSPAVTDGGAGRPAIQ